MIASFPQHDVYCDGCRELRRVVIMRDGTLDSDRGDIVALCMVCLDETRDLLLAATKATPP